MMQLENPMTFVRAIKGAPASVLWAMLFTRRMMTALELQQWTGYKGDNLTVALRLLVDLGWVTARSARGPWALAEGRQLPLMSTLLENSDAPDSDLIGVEGAVNVNVVMEESGEKRLPALTNSGRNPIKSDSRKKNEKILGFKTIVKADEDIAACLAVLNEAGIYGKKADEIAEDWHITVEMIRAHLLWIKSQEWENPLGMVIYRLLNHVPAPELRENGHALTCTCVECRASKRYSEGEFSEMINQGDDEDESEKE